MIVLDALAQIAFTAWGLFTLWVVFQILKLVWPVIKEDWFWFATKSSYYIGFLFGIAWFFIAMVPSAWLGEAWMLVPLFVQFGIAAWYIRNKHLPKLEKFVWFGIPFFMLPLWLTVRQGQQQGEIPKVPILQNNRSQPA